MVKLANHKLEHSYERKPPRLSTNTPLWWSSNHVISLPQPRPPLLGAYYRHPPSLPPPTFSQYSSSQPLSHLPYTFPRCLEVQAPHQSPQPQHFDNRRLYEPERYPRIQDAHHRSLLSVAYQQHAPLGCQPAERESIMERDFGELNFLSLHTHSRLSHSRQSPSEIFH